MPLEGGEGVVDGPRIVSERAGVDDDRRSPPPGGVDGVDQLALVIGLEALDGVTVLGGGRGGGRLVVGERGRAVHLRLA